MALIKIFYDKTSQSDAEMGSRRALRPVMTETKLTPMHAQIHAQLMVVQRRLAEMDSGIRRMNSVMITTKTQMMDVLQIVNLKKDGTMTLKLGIF